MVVLRIFSTSLNFFRIQGKPPHSPRSEGPNWGIKAANTYSSMHSVAASHCGALWGQGEEGRWQEEKATCRGLCAREPSSNRPQLLHGSLKGGDQGRGEPRAEAKGGGDPSGAT